MIRAVIALFGAGIASFLAPCVLPLVPAYLGLVVSSSNGEDGDGDGHERARRRRPRALRTRQMGLVGATGVFVGGFTAVFVLFGSAAGVLGRSLDRIRGALELAGGIIIVVFGLALIGWVRGPLSRTARLAAHLPSGGIARPAVLGITFGAAWTPCVGPLLGAALIAATRTGSPLRGAVLLAAYGAGLGLPFIAAALGLLTVPAVRNATRRWSSVMNRVGGVALIALGVLVVSGRYSALVSALARLRN